MSRHLVVRYLERTPYREGLALQKDLAEKRKQGLIEDTLLLLEHDPVITLGRNTGQASLLASPVLLESRGVDLVESDRGGDATFHGPGQVVGYPIIDLRPDRKDIRRYVRSIEAVMIGTLAHFGVQAEGRVDTPGVWLSDPDRKIGAIGARVSRWVTHHGFALNVNTDLSFFDLIIPCGIRDKGVTSMARELGRTVSISDVMAVVVHEFAAEFDRTIDSLKERVS
ncbi:MAG: octanoyltransferase [Myxococcales bacterium]|nr:octanoyltransferase [Myxococcales bacterium]